MLNWVKLVIVAVGLSCAAQARGELTWWFDLDNSSSSITPAIIDRITDSMDVAVAYYNHAADYGPWDVSYDGQGIRVIYSSGVPTANASYRGRIAFGGSRSEHTAMHELSHVLGIGTISAWDYASNRDSSTNKWVGEAALNELSAILGDPNPVLNADHHHFWPYGLNGNDGDRIAHVRMVGAFREDMGLSNGNINSTVPVLAHYTFDTDLTSSDSHAGSTASDFQLDSKILHSTITNTLRAEGNDPLNVTFNSAANNGFTADFSITSPTGVDLDHMEFQTEFDGMDAGETGTLVLRSSADGFQSDIISISNTDGSTTGTTKFPVRVDLTSFTDVNDLTFRFYFLGDNSWHDERTRILGPLTLRGVLSPLTGDFDMDGDVDDADFGIAFAAFTGPGNGPPSNTAADLDNDGDVDDADFGIAFAAFTGPGGAATVPEPTSLMLLGLSALIVVRRNRR